MKKGQFIGTVVLLSTVLGFGAGVLITARPEADQITIDRAVLSQLSESAGQTRIVPTFRDGVAEGFKVLWVQPGSAVEQLGLKNGDVVKRLGGIELNDPERALEAYAALASASKVDVELDRRGVSKRLRYIIKWLNSFVYLRAGKVSPRTVFCSVDPWQTSIEHSSGCRDAVC